MGISCALTDSDANPEKEQKRVKEYGIAPKSTESGTENVRALFVFDTPQTVAGTVADALKNQSVTEGASP
jgi:hypothetical protein